MQQPDDGPEPNAESEHEEDHRDDDERHLPVMASGELLSTSETIATTTSGAEPSSSAAVRRRLAAAIPPSDAARRGLRPSRSMRAVERRTTSTLTCSHPSRGGGDCSGRVHQQGDELALLLREI